MSNFVVYNENGGIIVDDTFKHVGNVAQNVITTLPKLGGFPITLSFDSVAPSWFPVTTMDTQVLNLKPIEGAVPMSVLMPNSEAYGAGRGTFSTNAGTLYCLRNDYTLSSGYLDVFDASGKLIKSLSGNNTKEIKLSTVGFVRGVYILKITSEKGITTKKVIL